jgi:hypothetical protein
VSKLTKKKEEMVVEKKRKQVITIDGDDSSEPDASDEGPVVKKLKVSKADRAQAAKKTDQLVSTSDNVFAVLRD